MVLLVVVIAIALYGVLYFYGGFLVQENGVGVDLLLALKQMIFHLPNNIAMILLKWGIGLALLYLLFETILNATRPKSSFKRRKKRFWRS